MYFEITNEGELQYDFTLPAQQGVNKVILHKMRIALLGYREEFAEVPNFAQRLRRMCTDHFRNKQAIFRRDPAVQANINCRHRRRSRKEKVSIIIFFDWKELNSIVNTSNRNLHVDEECWLTTERH